MMPPATPEDIKGRRYKGSLRDPKEGELVHREGWFRVIKRSPTCFVVMIDDNGGMRRTGCVSSTLAVAKKLVRELRREAK